MLQNGTISAAISADPLGSSPGQEGTQRKQWTTYEDEMVCDIGAMPAFFSKCAHPANP